MSEILEFLSISWDCVREMSKNDSDLEIISSPEITRGKFYNVEGYVYSLR